MAYAFSGPRWGGTQITWNFAAGNYAKDAGSPFSHGMGATPQAYVRSALDIWGGVAGLDFVQVADAPSAGLRFGWGRFGPFASTVGETKWTSTGSPAVFDPDVIIRLRDPDEKTPVLEAGTGAFVYAGTSSTLYAVMLHKVGHAIGLAHNNDPTSILYPTSGTANRQLNSDDRFGVQLLYGDLDQNFRATGAAEFFFGFAGTDTVPWTGRLADYTIGHANGGYTISRNASPADRDFIFEVETLRFADARFSLASDTGLFDPVFYARANPDVVAAGRDLREHFDASGWREGRAPDAVFDPACYLGANADVRAAGLNPLDHYQSNGWREGRDPGAGFDAKLYLARNPDVARAGFEPLTHYLLSGKAEGRAAAPALGDHVVAGFDAQHYLLTGPDVGRTGADPYRHWQEHGRFEGRSPDAYFDTVGYLGRYADVARAGVDPLAHYMTNGWREGRDPSAAFDTRKYLPTYTDVARAGLNPLDHFLNSGAYEGRVAFNDGAFS